jgi:amino acid transporter
MSRKTITLTTAILLVLNTMIGGGLFVNPKQLALNAAALSPLGYLLAALLMLPLILSIAELARLQPVSGGLYVYSKTYINQFAGFLSGWSYFLSKSTSAAFLLYTVGTFFSRHLTILDGVPPLVVATTLILFFTTLHIIGISIRSKIQYLFSAMKFTPLIFGFTAGFITFDSANLNIVPAEFSLATLSTILPVCIYALIGFEIICSIGSFIENPVRNIQRTILIAFTFVSCAAIFFQLAMFGALGASLSSAAEPMLSLGLQFVGEHIWLAKIMNGLVFASISGGAFFMLGSNCWNLHTLAANNHLPFKNLLTKLNRWGSPWIALLLQAATSITMVAITTEQLALQNMVVFGLFSTFLVSCFAAVQAGKQGLLKIPRITPILAIGTCAYILGMCFFNIIKFGISFSFLSFFIGGCSIALVTHYFKKSV